MHQGKSDLLLIPRIIVIGQSQLAIPSGLILIQFGNKSYSIHNNPDLHLSERSRELYGHGERVFFTRAVPILGNEFPEDIGRFD